MKLARRRWCTGALAGAGALLLGAVSAQALGAAGSHRKERVVKVIAQKFRYTPNQIHVRQGEIVMLEFTALDFVHGFSVPDLQLRSDLAPGQVTRVLLPTDRAGVFDFLCDNFCGSGHEEMNGKIVIS